MSGTVHANPFIAYILMCLERGGKMIRKLAIGVLILGAIIILPHLPSPQARGNQFKGILPPQRLAKQAPAEELEIAEPEYPQLLLVINIPARKVSLIDEGREVARYDVAVGQPIFKTPAGPQEVKTIIWNPWWIPPDSPWARGAEKAPPGPNNPLGPVKLMMGQGIRLHGTNKDKSVGRSASHGCLRMHNKEAAELAWYIQKRINNSDDSLFEKYKQHRRSSFHVKLDTALAVEIVYEPVEIRDNKINIYADFYGWAGNIRTEVLSALMKSGIDLRKIDASRLEQLKYPRNRHDVLQIGIDELLASTPRADTSFASLDLE